LRTLGETLKAVPICHGLVTMTEHFESKRGDELKTTNRERRRTKASHTIASIYCIVKRKESWRTGKYAGIINLGMSLNEPSTFVKQFCDGRDLKEKTNTEER